MIAGLNMISFGISSFTFSLAFNRWDVIAKPDFVKFINGDVISIVSFLFYICKRPFDLKLRLFRPKNDIFGFKNHVFLNLKIAFLDLDLKKS